MIEGDTLTLEHPPGERGKLPQWVSAQDLSALLGITTPHLGVLAQRGIAIRKERDVYDLPGSVQSILQHYRNSAQPQSETPDYAAKIKELQFKEKARELIRLDDAERVLCDAISDARRELSALASVLAPQLKDKDESTIQHLISARIEHILRTLARRNFSGEPF